MVNNKFVFLKTINYFFYFKFMIRKIILIFNFLLLTNCQNFGQLKLLTDLPKTLKEVSGTEIIVNSELIWMLNDGGNSPKLFGLSKKGKIKKEIYIKAKNHDWEDLTSNENGTIYIGDFGNNESKRENLAILIVDENSLNKKNVDIKRIRFKYPNQHKFPPKKKQKYFDSEAFFYFKNALYIFTKSRVKNKYGKTTLYKIPAKEGNYTAELIGEFDNGKKTESWITSADISNDGKKVALLSPKNVLIFSNFKGDNFLSGNVKKIEFDYLSQKEGITFKDNNTLLITDEKSGGTGGNLYELKLN